MELHLTRPKAKECQLRKVRRMRAAPLAATVERVRARPEHRIYVAGIGVYIKAGPE